MNLKKVIPLSIISAMTIGIVVTYVVVNQSTDVTYYTVTFDSNGGTEIKSISVAEGRTFSRPKDPIKNGYFVTSWTLGENEWDFKKDKVMEDITLLANWDLQTYTIAFDSQGGTMPEDYKNEYTIESDFELDRPEKDNQIFTGWFDSEGNRIDSIKPGMYGNLTLTATWTGDFKAISEDESRGSINVYISETNPNEYTVTNNPVANKHHLFKGWYDKNGNLLSTNPKYTVIVNPDEVYYIYSRYMNDQEELEWNNVHGVNPTMLDNKIIYGMYPQSNVNDSELLDKLNQLDSTRYNNYYYYNHEYYTKKISKLARDLETKELLSIRQFDNGDEFEENETYWFKVEPLSWKILGQDAGTYSLLSEKLLDVQRYHKNSATRTIEGKTIYSNNYKYSDIREWLNGDFASTAFAFNQASLRVMEVDNSKGTTATPDSGFECDNTYDCVSLLSYIDYLNQPGSNRQVITTDFTRVSGANYSVDSSNLFSGYLWTRSPIETEKDNGTAVSRCNMNGTLNNDFVGWGGSCVQPSITITL